MASPADPASGIFTVTDLIILQGGNSSRSSESLWEEVFGVSAGKTPSRNHLGCRCALGASV